MNKSRSFLVATLLISATVSAAPPQLKTPSPVIYLEDNLDESKNLGWCIDTQGRGFSEQLHTHSCKPQGGDVQFAFEPASGQIMSVAFENKCMTLLETEETSASFGLFDCDAGDVNQQFSYDQDSLEIRLKSDSTMCVIVGDTSQSAGPFQSRGLSLSACADTENALKRWVVNP